MDAVDLAEPSRQEKGLALAKVKRIRQLSEGRWLVPSATHAGSYLVDVHAQSCTCPDYETRALKCKHQWALSYARHEVTAADGTKVSVHTMRLSYSQDWGAYNAAQVAEKERVRVLLAALCDGIQEPSARGRKRRGNRYLPLREAVYATTMKVYSGMSGRRASTDIRDCASAGLLAKPPSYNVLFDYMAMPTLTPLIQTLIAESASPIAAVDQERQFAVDATGFTTSVFDSYRAITYPRRKDQPEAAESAAQSEVQPKKRRISVKLNVAVGVRTNIVTAAVATTGTLHEGKQLAPLVRTTAERFKVEEVVADKAYVDNKIFEDITALGAVPYIPFRSNDQGTQGTELWRKLWHIYSFHRREFLEHYHQRSNVEATFSAIKRKFGGSVRSRKEPAQINEALLKVLCHNLSMVVHTTQELGLDPVFWRSKSSP